MGAEAAETQWGCYNGGDKMRNVTFIVCKLEKVAFVDIEMSKLHIFAEYLFFFKK